MADQIESHEASGVGPVSRQNASVARFAKRSDGGEQCHFLWRHFGKAVEPEAVNLDWNVDLDSSRNASVAKSNRLFASCKSCSRSQSAYFSESNARSWSLSRSSPTQFFAPGERAEFGGRELVLLKFGEQRAEFLREAGAAGAAAKQFQFIRMPQQQGAQHHEPAFGGKQFRRRDVEFFKNELCQPVEGKNLQPREAGNLPGFEQLAFELKCGLFRREKDQWLTGGIAGQCGTDFGEAAESFAAAGGAEEKARLHAGIFTQRRKGAKEFIVNNAPAFFISFRAN